MHIKITMLTLASLFSAGEERIELPLTVLETCTIRIFFVDFTVFFMAQLIFGNFFGNFNKNNSVGTIVVLTTLL